MVSVVCMRLAGFPKAPGRLRPACFFDPHWKYIGASVFNPALNESGQEYGIVISYKTIDIFPIGDAGKMHLGVEEGCNLLVASVYRAFHRFRNWSER